ncbi:hypothetical protein CAI21_15160 [Alkalilimnicola ehrlichii]|uniref:Transcriptional regulator LmrA/YxaF-like C-terminal domain-containing protein n=1 Tax=Alkalilimnicola ehrlichii TaxID=351052 RepID=A0A3E0WQW7_9GAMM|nr:hypothetical protein [Alkalilimnicola ehrlichii]RFA27187.1 hypothetical protein CAI21_15160 [Alkalilimnicola ehrlichii]RFA35360.1 hypothetical protein CAL65_12815 [Alkalilimnicola ehrlichii]
MTAAILEYFCEYRICLMAHMSLEDIGHLPAAQEKIGVFFQRWIAATAHVLSEVHEQQRAQAFAEDIVSRIEGAAILLHVHNNDAPLKRACEEAIALVRVG